MLDKNGFLWFGTKDGLNRFDGYSFKVFRNDPDNKESIGSNFIHCLYEDHHGIVWVGTENGLFRYDATSESFHQFDTLMDASIRDFKVDSKENLWYIAGFTLIKYSHTTKKFRVYDVGKYFEASSIDTSSGGTVWVSSTTGLLNRYDPETDSFIGYDMFSHSPQSVSKWIEKIQCTNSSILIGTSTQGAKIFDLKNFTYKDILTYNKDKTGIFVRNFVRTSENEFWIATESGIYIYNTETGLATNLGKKYNDPYSISDNAVYTFCKDHEGGIWAGTYFGGINYYPKPNTPFKKYFPKVGENSLSGNVVREIREDKYGNLWIGTEDAGLNKLEKETGKFIHYQPSGAKGSISYTNIHGLLVIDDELWIGTFEHGLDVMNIKTGKVIRRFYMGTANPTLKSNFFYCIYQMPDGEIILGTTRGAYWFNHAKNRLELAEELPDNDWYTSIIKDNKGNIWASTYGNGVNHYNTKTKKSTNYKYDPSKTNTITSNRVNGIFEDSDRNIWFATESGLCKYNEASNDFKRYTSKNGLPGDFILSILEDNQKNLWISTSKGLVSFNLKSESLNVYTIDNGLLSDQFNFSSAYKDANGRMYFGSAKGLVSFHPNEIKKNTFIPPVYITGFQVFNKELAIAKEGTPLQRSIAFTKKITLAYDESTFSLDFAALSYTSPMMLEYAYKMEGLDKDWTYLKTNRKVYFTELSPGTYVFKVKATNGSGIWNGEETKLQIEILSPWWASWQAYAIYTLLALAIVYVIIRNYHKKVEMKNRRKIELLQIAKEKEILQAKIEFFTNVAHEIRTPLTLIKGPLEKVVKKAQDKPELSVSLRIMEKNTNRLIELTNQLLDFRQTEIKGFSLSFVRVNISGLLSETYLNFKTLAEEKNISYTITAPRRQVQAYVDQEALNKILCNLFSNAVKYAENKVEIVLLPVRPEDAYFTIEIRNDGYIIPYEMRDKIFLPFFRLKETEKQKGTGIGLALARSLAELHKGSLELKETKHDLNIFSLRLPIHQENEFDLYDEKSTIGMEPVTK